MLVQLPADASRRLQIDDPRTWAPAAHMGDLDEAFGFGLAQP